MDKLDFLDGETPAQTAAPESEAPATPVEQTALPEAASQPRGPDGKFAPKTTPEASATPAPEPQTPAPPPEVAQPAAEPAKPPEGFVPIGVVQELRKEIQALKQQPPQQPQQPRLRPGDEGFEEEQQMAAYEAVVAGRARVQVARQYAIKAHGEEAVNSALEWARQRADFDPAFASAAQAADDPVAFAIEEHEYHQALGKLRDPQARANFMAFLNGQAPAQQPALAPVSPNPTPPPPSITAAPSAGGAQAVPTGPGQAYSAVFG